MRKKNKEEYDKKQREEIAQKLQELKEKEEQEKIRQEEEEKQKLQKKQENIDKTIQENIKKQKKIQKIEVQKNIQKFLEENEENEKEIIDNIIGDEYTENTITEDQNYELKRIDKLGVPKGVNENDYYNLIVDRTDNAKKTKKHKIVKKKKNTKISQPKYSDIKFIIKSKNKNLENLQKDKNKDKKTTIKKQFKKEKYNFYGTKKNHKQFKDVNKELGGNLNKYYEQKFNIKNNYDMWNNNNGINFEREEELRKQREDIMKTEKKLKDNIKFQYAKKVAEMNKVGLKFNKNKKYKLAGSGIKKGNQNKKLYLPKIIKNSNSINKKNTEKTLLLK